MKYHTYHKSADPAQRGKSGFFIYYDNKMEHWETHISIFEEQLQRPIILRANGAMAMDRLRAQWENSHFQFVTILCPGMQNGLWRTDIEGSLTGKQLQDIRTFILNIQTDTSWRVILGDVTPLAGFGIIGQEAPPNHEECLAAFRLFAEDNDIPITIESAFIELEQLPRELLERRAAIIRTMHYPLTDTSIQQEMSSFYTEFGGTGTFPSKVIEIITNTRKNVELSLQLQLMLLGDQFVRGIVSLLLVQHEVLVATQIPYIADQFHLTADLDVFPTIQLHDDTALSRLYVQM